MKTMIALFIGLISTNAFASYSGADQEYPIVKCEQAKRRADDGLYLEVVTGGFAGLTRVQVSQSYIWGVQETSYIVKETPANPRDFNPTTVFKGANFSLSIYSILIDENGKHAGVVKFKQKNGVIHTDNVKCEFVSREL